MIHHGMPLQHILSNHMQRTSMGGSQGFVLQEYHGGVWGKGVWKWLKAKTSSGRSNDASEGVDENIWKVHAVTKQQRKHECAREELSQEEERGESPIQLFVCVL
jgi:hypothetical protein